MSDPTMQCRGKGAGGEGGGMRTVECLRGRLLAERVASKAAKEEADQLANRLDELEKKLSDEVKIRNKAERRLRRAIKKLESLKILDVELSGSSIGSLSSNGCSGHQAPEMEERNNPGSLSTVDSVRSGGEAKEWDGGDGDSARGSSSGSCTRVNSSQDGSWFSVVSEQSGSGPCKRENRMDPDDTRNYVSPEDAGDRTGDFDHDLEREQQPAASNGPSKSEASYRDEDDDRLAVVLVDGPHHSAEAGSPRTEHDARAAELHAAETTEEGEEQGNKLAIVLADPQLRRPDAETEMRGSGSGNDVQSVLLALRQVKEQLRYTIERTSEGLVARRELYGH